MKRLSAAAFAVLAGASCAIASGPAGSEFPAENAALLAATTAFFEQVEAASPRKDRIPVIGRPAQAMKISADPAPATQSLTRYGPVDHLTGYRITWYPMERLLGSVDFMGTWDGNRNLVCGYLTWDLTDPDAPRLDQVNASFVDLAELDGQSSDVIHGRLLEANCAYGAIEANFHIFDTAG